MDPSDFLFPDPQRLLASLESMEIAYFQADAQGRTTFSNSIESKITGYASSELMGLPRAILYAEPSDRERMFMEAQRNEGKAQGLLLKGRRKDGTTFWGECDIRVHHDPSGALQGTDGFYRDVSARIELQSFLDEDTDKLLDERDLLKNLKEEAEFHRDYLSSIGHQVLSPLGAVAGMLGNLRQGVPSKASLSDRLHWAEGQTKVCARLVRNLAYLDRLLRGDPIELKKVSFGRLAVETKLDFIHQLQAKHLDFEVDDESLDRLLPRIGNPELLRQIFVNLLDNAIKYSRPRTRIRLGAKVWPQGHCLEMSSRGLSVPPSLREAIFKRRFRTQKAKAAVPDGTGLGLWLVRKIVEAHGAKISCSEVQEDGEVRVLFRIIFPRSQASESIGPRRRGHA